MNPQNKVGINPITVRPDQNSPWAKGPHAVLARLGVMNHRTVSLMSVPPDVNEDNAAEKLTATLVATVPEDKFIEALGHLFPRGELAHCHLVGGDTTAAVAEALRDLRGGSPAADKVTAASAEPAAPDAPEVRLAAGSACWVALEIQPYSSRYLSAAPALAASAVTMGARSIELRDHQGTLFQEVVVGFATPIEMSLRLPAIITAVRGALAAAAADTSPRKS